MTSSSTSLAPFWVGVASASLLWLSLLGALVYALPMQEEEEEEEEKGGEESSSSSSPAEDDTTSRRLMRRLSSSLGEMSSPTKLKRRVRWPWDKKKKKRSVLGTEEPKEVPNNHDDNNNTSNSSSTNPRDEPRAAAPNKSGLCIGSIFGLDVGGTLAKLVYFEEQSSTEYTLHDRELAHFRHHELQYHQAACARTVLEARRGTSSSSWSQFPLDEIHTKEHKDDTPHPRSPSSIPHSKRVKNDLKTMYQVRQASLPDNLNEFAEHANIHTRHVHSNASLRNVVLGDFIPAPTSSNGVSPPPLNPPLQATAATGGGMKRCRSMFDMSKSRDHAEALDRFYNFARRLDTYETGVKDKHLSFYSRELGGMLHFIRFETRRMEAAMELIRVNNLHLNIERMGAAGGGAHKFAADWDLKLGIKMVKQDELDSLVAGMQFVLADVVGECYTYRPREKHIVPVTAPSKNIPSKVTTDAGGDGDETPPSVAGTSLSSSDTSAETGESLDAEQQRESRHRDSSKRKAVDEWWWSRKVQRDVVSDTYPYLLVTIGTGVSILRVDGPRKHERISGSTIGGGTYWGLCRLLTDVEDFEDVLTLAEHGDPSKVDMMVGDIYGNKGDALEKLGLPADVVASSFGKLVAKPDPAAGLKQEDLARALLLMVTNNIGQVAYLNAQLHKTPRIYFVGNFLRHNQISRQRLAFAIDYWSKGEMEALFLEHEGYFGALGAFLLSQGISSSSKVGLRFNGATSSSSDNLKARRARSHSLATSGTFHFDQIATAYSH